ncbi:MAG: Thioredoxin [Candidatus Woesebacteria bacterium GW2011_GWA2_44_33]|uniref:Thioredoxin n=2 Tax=Candidatus Woeseibacteriota TaxID=1752722 RepID=A0A0G1QFW3_9BACT|nr:MAG: Thioredoxin [Candidatus Woesebacteria bacterium GW2011_GWA2_44_33]KKU16623.1 MAG: Thioredoxin [Candidatus Woesebacteria bacterium GW2011_GWC2_45_9]
MATSNITDADFEAKVLKSGAPVLVDFWAPWCGPCKLAEPVLEELSNTYNGKVAIMKLNVDENQGSAAKYSVMSIPTTILFKGGAEVGRQVGFAGEQAFEDLIKKGVT